MASPEHLHGRLAAAAAQARWRWFSIICDCAWLARTVEGRLAAAATVARWRWFPIICDCAWLLQGTSTNAWRPRPPWLAGAGFRLFAIVPGISRVRPRTPGGRGHRGSLALVPDYLRLCLASPGHVHGRLAAAAAQARWRCFSIICDCAWVGPGLSRARPRKPCGRGRPGSPTLVFDYLRVCLASPGLVSPGYVPGRLAAAATVARWRWFPIICDCAWPLQGTCTDAWRPRPPRLAEVGFRLFAVVPGLSRPCLFRARPRTPAGRGHRGSLALVPDYLRVCPASPGHVHGRLAAAAAVARLRWFSIVRDCGKHNRK